MRLVIDTDAFCKLGASGLLGSAASALGCTEAECARLPALPHMLKRGSLAKRLGPDRCAEVLARVPSFAAVPPASTSYLEPFIGVPDVDAGEAQLFALVAEHGSLLLTGDKRALRAAGRLAAVADSLNDKLVTLEALLLRLVALDGAEHIRSSVQSIADLDGMIKVCFSASNSNPAAALESYFSTLEREVAPLRLWRFSSDHQDGSPGC